jgi:hypothetical protein
MFYSKPTKNEDGLYFVKTYTDDKKKIFLQVKGDAKHDDGEVHFRLVDDASKIQAIDDENIEAAKLNAVEWFGKKVGDATLERAYTKSLSESQVTTDVIKATKIFDSGKHIVEVDTLGEWTGCTGLVEFAGLWFAKKAFGPVWNVVQVKLNPVPEPEPEPEPEVVPESEPEDEYPDEYAIEDDQ